MSLILQKFYQLHGSPFPPHAGPEHTTKNPSTSEPRSDPVKSDLVFAPDSQTENFMIQQVHVWFFFEGRITVNVVHLAVCSI